MSIRFGKQIKEMRLAHGMTQEQFSKICGLGLASIQRYESNERQPTIAILGKMADSLHMSLQDFLWGKPEQADDIDIYDYFPLNSISADWEKLNFKGQAEAIKRIHELTMVKDYTEGED